MLENAPELEALTIFDQLRKECPGKFQDGQLRTLERLVREWRLSSGKGKDNIASIPQPHKPAF